MTQKPTIGRIVHYPLTVDDADAINKRRDDGKDKGIANFETGLQLHYGDRVSPGEVLPAIVTKVWGNSCIVDLKVFLNGNDDLWVRHVIQMTPGGDEYNGLWFWPPRD